ncbi:DinB family protein [Kitasatospora sp. YST-16]|uniref:DinB family protein n=1 Tax=Kitasatospora sp. YST-16 TaxID=2998080 RepID=UPI00228432A7|nr:DinB family protein [Kitasatospora sp. YST-16]WAL72642.1 DinB family protein [Kitasatospora sp. YST-16]WNW38690.1 DinB family protein [Streptomyces sp. Li-HN-5-13]
MSNDVQPVLRIRAPEAGTECETLTGLLDFLRATVINKVAGLSDEQAFAQPVPPSTLTPAGVVKHLAGTERFWFSIDFADQDLAWPWTEEDPHGNFRLTPEDTLARIVADYAEECKRSRQVVADAVLDDVARGPGMTFSLRYALAHMIEETARHCGHLDLLRESIDGVVGE